MAVYSNENHERIKAGTGGLKIFPLSEGSFTIDKTKLFIPFDEKKDVLTDRASGKKTLPLHHKHSSG